MWKGCSIKRTIIGRVFLGKVISPGQKQGQPILGIEFPCNQWEVAPWSEWSSLFSCDGGGGLSTWRVDFLWKVILFCFVVFSMWGREGQSKEFPSPNMFHKEFSIELHFYPTCFNKHCPPFTSIGGPKGKNSILQNRTFYLDKPP
jgi:hypothetical protein